MPRKCFQESHYPLAIRVRQITKSTITLQVTLWMTGSLYQDMFIDLEIGIAPIPKEPLPFVLLIKLFKDIEFGSKANLRPILLPREGQPPAIQQLLLLSISDTLNIIRKVPTYYIIH